MAYVLKECFANPNNYEKGLDVLKYFNRLLDKLFCPTKTSLIAGNSQ